MAGSLAAFGCQSMVAPLRRVLVRRPDAAYGNADPAVWHYGGQPSLPDAQREHDELVGILEAAGAEVLYQDEPQPERADAIYVHDPAIVTDRGAVILRMGKDLRTGEEDAMARSLQGLEVPVLARLQPPARAEGGDLLWLDASTLAVGIGFRSNREGARQLAQALGPLGIRVQAYDLPYDRGPGACLHLMSLISLVDEDLAVVFPPLLPAALWSALAERGVRIVEAPEREFRATQATNVLALAPRRCLLLEGNPVTVSRLRGAGCDVETYRGAEISMKGEGGPTCLTRPILRG